MACGIQQQQLVHSDMFIMTLLLLSYWAVTILAHSGTHRVVNVQQVVLCIPSDISAMHWRRACTLQQCNLSNHKGLYYTS